MAENNVVNEAAEVIENVTNNGIPVTVVKTSNMSKVVLGVAVFGIIVGTAVGITKIMKKKAAKASEDSIDIEIEVEDLTENAD